MTDLQQIEGAWFPDHDTHFAPHLRRGSYQYNHRSSALSFCRRWEVAIDVGAHVGLWARELERRFDLVQAFEPIPENLICLARNTNPRRTRIHPFALGDGSRSRARFHMVREGNSGTWTAGDGALEIEERPLDSFGMTADLLKIDAECSELSILRGAEETIRRSRPVICVELRDAPTLRKAGFPIRYEIPEVIEFLTALEYRLAERIVADHIFVPEEDPDATA